MTKNANQPEREQQGKFKEFLRSRAITDDPEGDFVKDALGDASLPDVKSYEQLKRYIVRRPRSFNDVDIDIVIGEARRVWEEFIEWSATR